MCSCWGGWSGTNPELEDQIKNRYSFSNHNRYLIKYPIDNRLWLHTTDNFRTIKFTWVCDTLMIAEDPFGQYGPSLCELLHFWACFSEDSRRTDRLLTSVIALILVFDISSHLLHTQIKSHEQTPQHHDYIGALKLVPFYWWPFQPKKTTAVMTTPVMTMAAFWWSVAVPESTTHLENMHFYGQYRAAAAECWDNSNGLTHTKNNTLKHCIGSPTLAPENMILQN